MPYSIEQLRDIITPIARQHGVKRVYLFGSYARGTATDRSDIDLIAALGFAGLSLRRGEITLQPRLPEQIRRPPARCAADTEEAAVYGVDYFGLRALCSRHLHTLYDIL